LAEPPAGDANAFLFNTINAVAKHWGQLYPTIVSHFVSHLPMGRHNVAVTGHQPSRWATTPTLPGASPAAHNHPAATKAALNAFRRQGRSNRSLEQFYTISLTVV